MMNDGEPDTLRLYAWLSRDSDGVEGIITAMLRDRYMPLVTTGLEQALSLTPIAQHSADGRGQVAKLVQFERGMTLRVLDPLSTTVTVTEQP